jgi:hypothetical protein
MTVAPGSRCDRGRTPAGMQPRQLPTARSGTGHSRWAPQATPQCPSTPCRHDLCRSQHLDLDRRCRSLRPLQCRPGARAPGAHEHRPQPTKHGPYGLVGTDIQRALQTQRSDSVLVGSKKPASGEPQGQRCSVRSKTVPAVTEPRTPQATHLNRPSPNRQPLRPWQAGQTNWSARAATPGSPGGRHRI